MHFHKADLFSKAVLDRLIRKYGGRVAFAFAFPPCTELSVVGARWWAAKAKADPFFQERAVRRIRQIYRTLTKIGCPFIIENPASSRLNQMWRQRDLTFQPFDYGGYLPVNDRHPSFGSKWPKRDSYSKPTGLWTSQGIELPPPKSVKPVWYEWTPRSPGATRKRMSPLFGSWGSTSLRNATPRGWSEAMARMYA